MQLVCERSCLRGRVDIPGSKSHTIRAVAIASLAEGQSRIEAPLESADSLAAVEAYRALAAAFPEDRVRFDPNGVWSTEQAIRFGQAIEGLRNDYLEDPVFGLNGMRRTREKVRMPLATNTVVVNFEQLAANALESAAYGDKAPFSFPNPKPGPAVRTFDRSIADLPIARLVEIGKTAEGRSQIMAIITSPANLKKLEKVTLANTAIKDVLNRKL